MKILLSALAICLSLAAAPTFADRWNGDGDGGVGDRVGDGHEKHGAPAPLIGVGVLPAVAVGGGVLAVKLLRRRRNNRPV